MKERCKVSGFAVPILTRSRIIRLAVLLGLVIRNLDACS